MDGETVVRTMSALESLSEDRDVVSHLIGTVYELAMRLGVCPRTIAEQVFCAVTPDRHWHDVLEPALRDVLGRD